MKRNLQISNDENIILFSGRINRDKGVFNLINAIINLRKSHKVFLLLVGPKDFNHNILEENEFENFINKYNEFIRHINFTF